MSFDIAAFSYSGKRATQTQAPSRYFMIKARGQSIGLPVDCVKTVFNVDNLTPVPLAPREVAGLANLRGRIVTVLHLDRCLGLDDSRMSASGLAVGIERNGEEYALLVDETEDVVATDEGDRVSCPTHVGAHLAELIAGCYRYDEGFLSILDVDAMLRRLTKLSEAMLRDGRKSNSNQGATS
jgi:purine-binding chemotaxis protein CheW